MGFLARLTEKILQDREDDTRSLNSISVILKLVMFQVGLYHCTSYVAIVHVVRSCYKYLQKGVSDESLEKHTKNFYVSKSKLELKLIGGKHTQP